MDHCEDCGMPSDDLEMELVFNSVPRQLCPICRQTHNSVTASLLDSLTESPPLKQADPVPEVVTQPPATTPSSPEPIKTAPSPWWERLIELWPWSGRHH